MIDYASRMDEAIKKTLKTEQKKRGLAEWKEHEIKPPKEFGIEDWLIVDGRKLKLARLVADMSLRDLEKASGIDRHTIMSYEMAESGIPNMNKIRKLCEALGIDPATLHSDSRVEIIIPYCKERRTKKTFYLYKEVGEAWVLHHTYTRRSDARWAASRINAETRITESPITYDNCE